MAAVVVESAQTLMGLWIVGDICSCELRRQLKDLLLRVSRQGREKVGDKGQVVHSCSHSSARKKIFGAAYHYNAAPRRMPWECVDRGGEYTDA